MEITQSYATSAATGGGGARTMINSDFNTFLKMLTAQLENQDPLNPLDTNDFAVQLATFSSVEQQVRTNDLLGQIGAQLGLSEVSALAGWIGMEARAAMPAAFDGAPIEIAPSMPAIADSARLIVRNEAGEIVQESDIAVSAEPILWAGVGEGGAPMPPGLYSFQVESYAGGQMIEQRLADVYAEVTEARVENGQILLLFAGGAAVTTAQIAGLRRPAGG
jgi:flagellar basal-body rod modification protein FlgD